jgi:dimeric dUTPase (all-alpha-NTP-PPase superfamily)
VRLILILAKVSGFKKNELVVRWLELSKLFKMQKVLRERIIEQHDLCEQELLPNLICALNVEIGELANETRCFKHWSIKPPSSKEVILEEYVDVLHFILEVGLSDFEQYEHLYPINYVYSDTSPIKENSLVQQFNSMFTEVGILSDLLFDNCYSANCVEDAYENLFRLFIGLGEMLGFTWLEVEQAYISKNEINHQRQEQGY